MKQIVRRATGGAAAVALATLVLVGCGDDENGETADAASSAVAGAMSDATGTSGEVEPGSVELTAADGSTVTLTGPIAAKFQAATDQQKQDLGAPMTGEDASGTSDSGVVFQQFEGGVITAQNADEGTPAYITWGKIRDAWNVNRDESGMPSEDGEGGSDGPLGAATSDETDSDGVKESTFENGTITWDPATDTVEVTVNGEVVPAE
ncbi:hypothetical protein V1Y59_19535 [Gordonia sp. PKS22-38]|uniref:LGFP repeat-containing protein n=1 Tax=Gordonia prachuapensis TaxID=3115651 RepID=A0ABU7MYQ0_9ACTN|nr:hypothetical protein [Gordonia sp. PKS22-38]